MTEQHNSIPAASPLHPPSWNHLPTIMQWNCNGLRGKLNEISLFLRKYPIPILAISEGGLPFPSGISGYTKYVCPTISTFPTGSAVLFIKNIIPQCAVDLRPVCCANAEFVAATVLLLNRKLTVVSVYMRPSEAQDQASMLERLTRIHQLCPGDVILCGDFNAHHNLWGSRSPTRRGRDIVQAMETLDLIVANTGEPTFFRPPNTYSAIDLTLHSSTLLVQWEVSADTMGSDHFPIFVTLPYGSMCSRNQKRVTHRIIYWDVFRKALDYTLGENHLVSSIQNSLAAATRTARTRPTDPTPDLKFLNLSAARRRAQRKLRRNPSRLNLVTFQRVSAVLRRYCNALRQHQWRSFCASLTPHTPEGRIWRVIDAMAGVNRKTNSFTNLALRLGVTVAEAADLFMGVFNPSARLGDAETVIDDSEHPMDALFTRHELSTALRKCTRRSSPGSDGITYQALKNLSGTAQDRLLHFFNEVWSSGVVPPSWKHAIIVPVHKAAKPPELLSSYRPVSLTSCMAKLMERMVLARLEWYLDLHAVLPDEMTGFRARLAATDNILEFCSATDSTHKTGVTLLATFLDIKNAFGCVSRGVVLHQLKTAGVTGRVLRFIASFLEGRSSQVRLGNVLGEPREHHTGLPQGSVLSPALFNLVLAGLPRAIPHSIPEVHLSIYADDVTLWVSGTRPVQLTCRMQQALSAANDYLTSVGLSISAEKSAYMVFNKKRRKDPGTLKINGTLIPRVKTRRFLGLTMDERCTWVPFVSETLTKARGHRNVQKKLCGTTWGSSPSAVLQLHKALMLSRILYGLPFTNPSPSRMTELERMHMGGLKTALGLPLAANNNATIKESGSLPLHLACTEKLFLQFDRLRATNTGQVILQKIQGHPQSRFANLLDSFLALAKPVPSLATTQAPWLIPELNCTTTIPFMPSKKRLPDFVVKGLTLDHIQTHYAACSKVYTDGSVKHEDNTSSAAFYIPQHNTTWNARISAKVSSTVAELIAINEALRAPISASLDPVVVLTDSRTALERLQFPRREDFFAWQVRTEISTQVSNGRPIHLQWIPSHVGIPGNELADQLAGEAHAFPHSIPAPPTACATRDAITNHVHCTLLSDTGQGDHQPPPCPTKGLPRRIATVLHRIRTRAAFTPAFLHKLERVESPLCEGCQSTCDFDHLLMHCPDIGVNRSMLFAELRRLGVHVTSAGDITHPVGPPALRRAIRDALITFLDSSGLLTVL